MKTDLEKLSIITLRNLLLREDERNECLAKAMPEIYRASSGVIEESTDFWAATLLNEAEYEQLPLEAKASEEIYLCNKRYYSF